MPSPNEVERPREAVTVAKRYLRRERPLNVLVVTLAVSVFLGTYLTASLLSAIAVAAVLVVAARAPVFRSRGTFRLRTDESPAAVVEEFAGPTPPVLALQWGIADGVSVGDDAVRYRTSYLFGLRSVTVAVRTRTDTAADGGERVELELTADDRPWATYTATVSGEGDGTVVDVEYESNRRFGVRRVPQQFVAERYRDDVLTAQGYTVVERDAKFGL